MPYSYLNASEGDFTTRVDKGDNHSEGFVVYDTDTSEEYGVFPSEEQAQQACAELNAKQT
ncbi:hypothetical protein [Halomonas sp. WWR20]